MKSSPISIFGLGHHTTDDWWQIKDLSMI